MDTEDHWTRWPATRAIFVAVVLICGMALVERMSAWPSLTGLDVAETSVAHDFATEVARVGISPIYPPTEDIQVGDIWARVIYRADKAPAEHAALLRRAARIGHIDLSAQLLEAAGRRPPYRTEGAEPGDRPRYDLAPPSAPEHMLDLAVVSFPSVTRRLSGRSSLAAGAGPARLRGAANDSIVEEITFGDPFGHGIDAMTGSLRLTEFCRAAAQNCLQPLLRRVLQGTLGTLDVPDNAEIEVMLITYVFSTRRMMVSRQLESSRTGGLQAGADPADAGGKPGASAEHERSRSTGSKTERVFARPVAIGYRAVTQASAAAAAAAAAR